MADLKDEVFLISLFNKKPYAELVQRLAEEGCSFIASSGTARWLEELEVQSRSVEEVFGLGERLDGKVKTLQPDIYTAIMGKDTTEIEGEYPAIGGVIIDLTPAEAAGEAEGFEKIDIGGVGLLRAAAKSWRQVTVVGSVAAAEFLKNNLPPDRSARRQLAEQALKRTLKYDKRFLGMLRGTTTGEKKERLSLEEVEELRYGENPAQEGYVGSDLFSADELPFNQLAGAGLSYTNCLDLDVARRLVEEKKRPQAVVIKHTNPTGWGSAQNKKEAFEKAWAGDPKSAYGGFAALNRPVDEALARPLVDKFLEGVVAPGFSREAVEILKNRERLRVIEWPDMFQTPRELIRNFGQDLYLCQEELAETDYNAGWEVVSERPPTEGETETLKQAWRVCRHVSSNSAVLAVRDQVLAVGAGQQSRVDAVELAVKKLEQFHADRSEPVLASDGFFPFADNIEVAAEAGVTAVVAPGGSIRDEEVISEANKQNIALVFAEERIFCH